jgi:hypothetical protein
MPAEKSAAGETRQWNLNRHAEGLIDCWIAYRGAIVLE